MITTGSSTTEMSLPFFVCVWLVLLQQALVIAVHSSAYPLPCTLDWQHVVELDFDASSGVYQVVQVLDPFDTEHNRNLRSSQYEQTAEILGVSKNAILARKCSCLEVAGNKEEGYISIIDETQETYCPLTSSICVRTTSSDTDSIECLSSNTPNKVNVVFWSTFISLAGLAVILLFTRFGRHVLGRFMSFFWGGFNDRVVTYILQRHPERARAMVPVQNNSQPTPSTATQTDEPKEPTRLLLRTQIYALDETTGPPLCKNTTGIQNDDETKNDDEGHDECSICFVELQVGDKIGNLTCDHNFRK
jgi:hypothetical protein